MRLPQFILRKFKRMIDDGYANCLIFAIYKQQTEGGKIVLQRTARNRIRWIVWWHVKWKPCECPYYAECHAEQAFEPIDGPDRYFPPFLFKGRVVKHDEKCSEGE